MKNNPVAISFNTVPYLLKDWTILPVPKNESIKLPSRGQVSVVGTINGHEFRAVLEPDGRWSHWLRVTDELQKAAHVKPGDTVSVEMTTIKDWPEPVIPEDFEKALNMAPEKVKNKWRDITPMARWEWIRWVNATGNIDTREIRIEKSISKLNGKHRRPCCFNLAACTEPYVAKNSQLIELTK